MHNLALALHDQGHHITGSDDEIYEPSRTRLAKAGLLPSEYGWYIDKIEPTIDAIILGMHARVDNPELIKAQELGLRIYSYPEFVAEQSKDKLRVVIAGSHGKTTTTSIILNALSSQGIDYDYLVGAQLEGFDRMVRLSDAKIIVLEGDEYLSSPIDRRPKMMHYDPDIAVITGVAWDHINVFPTLDSYVQQFADFIKDMDRSAQLYYYLKDSHLADIIRKEDYKCQVTGYTQIEVDDDKSYNLGDASYPIRLIGNHNLQNIKSAEFVCLQLGLTIDQFYLSLESFTGAAKRLQILRTGEGHDGHIYLDFAHAPSKLKATTTAVKDWYPAQKLVAVFELHTYSSLNAEFLPQYKDALANADVAMVLFSEHALKMKRMPMLDPQFVKECFGQSDLKVFTDKDELRTAIVSEMDSKSNLLLMSSGTFDGMDLAFS